MALFFFGPHHWRGESGRRYRFKCVLTAKGMPKAGEGGIYIFVRRRWAFFLEPLYVGKAADLRNRLRGHEKWARAYWYYGATERHVLGPIHDEVDRRRIEEDLIRKLKPRMNDVSIPKAKAPARRRNSAATHAFNFAGILGSRRPAQRAS